MLLLSSVRLCAVLTVKPANKGQYRAMYKGFKMIGIYKITNRINGKFYIGQSNNIERRFMEHKTPHGTITSIKLAIKKYGKENFLFEILEECKLEELDAKEVFWIETLKPQYNRCSGGMGARNHFVSDELKEHLRKQSLKYWQKLDESEKRKRIERMHSKRPTIIVTDDMKRKLRKANTGKKQTVETIEKRKATIQRMKENGYVQTNAGHRKRVVCVETNQIFESVKDAGNYFSVHPSSITGVLKGKYKTCKGKHFKYVV
jgi:group I intron endonuclease